MAQFLLVCLAGAAGTGARYLLGLGAARLLGTGFPYSTLAVNAVGSFLICLILEIALLSERVSPGLRVVLTTGFLGGLTTYSAFCFETLKMTRDGAHGAALVYLTLTLALGFAAGSLGFAAAPRLLGR